ncbi:MAG: hypothetical protein R6W31_07265 [Bacteroidales bacterium]
MAFILLLFLPALLSGQFYQYGQDAGKLRWYQFETPNYKVIFPEGVDSLAEAFANRIESYYPLLGKALDHNPGKMPVIIHNESSFSNGVFVWAPKRLEIFTNPDPNSYNQDWLTQLALHEGRHAVQIDKLNQGFSKGLYYLGGEQMVGLMAIFLPYWYLEGDAVDSETRLSNSGRGRQPSFEMELKAQMLEAGRTYSFSKATMGSYRHHIPDHYQLGYLMVRHGRRNYGDSFWIDFQNYAARKPFLLDPTLFSMRQYGLRSKTQFYKNAMEEYRTHWVSTDSGRILTPFIRWGSCKTDRENRQYINYRYPHMVSDSVIFACKSGLDQIPEFILMDQEGKEKPVFRPGYLSSGRVSVSDTHVVWDEFVPDTRWSNRNYSVIRSFELATGKVENLGKRTRFYAPAVSGDGLRVAVVEQSDLQKFSLVILGIDGTELRRVPSPGNLFIQHPAWMAGDSSIVLISSAETGKSLVSYSLGSGTWEILFDVEGDDISTPVVAGERIFFSATFSGIDNIYCFHVPLKETFQVTSSRFGAFHPHISEDGQRLCYANYTATGYKIAELTIEDGVWRSLAEARDHAEQLDYDLTTDGAVEIAADAGGDSILYPSKRYSKAGHLFNVHSWLPLYVDYLNPHLTLSAENIPVSLGVSLISQNHLSTAVSQIGYEYKNGYHMFHSGVQLKGRYPVFNLYFDYGGKPDVLLMDEEADTAMVLPRDMTFTAQTYIPFRLNTGKFLTLIQPRIEYQYRRELQYIEEAQDYRTGTHYLYYSLYTTSYLRMGARDIMPRMGMIASAGYYHAPFDNRVYGAVSITGLSLYLPGFLKHQTLKLTMQHQEQYPLDPESPALINLITMPRGLHGIFGMSLTRYSADYVFPVLYPDLELSSLLYLKRIRGGIWVDHMRGTDVIIMEPSPHFDDKNFTTLGADLWTDLNILRIPFPLSVGIRYIYESETGRSMIEWLYSIEIR